MNSLLNEHLGEYTLNEESEQEQIEKSTVNKKNRKRMKKATKKIIESNNEAKYYIKKGGAKKYNYTQLIWRKNNKEKFRYLGYYTSKQAAVDKIKQHCISFGHSFPPKPHERIAWIWS